MYRILGNLFLIVALAGFHNAWASDVRSGIAGLGLDETVRPQDDFFSYVNGKWLQSNEIPADQARWGVFPELALRMEKLQYDILENLERNPDAIQATDARKLRDLYKSYLDHVNRKGHHPVQMPSALGKILGVDSKSEWLLFNSDLRRYGVASPITVDVDFDLVNASRYAVYIYQGGLTLPAREAYLVDNDFFQMVLHKYKSYLEGIFRLADIGATPEDAKAVIGFETGLARIQWSETEMRDIERLYNPFDVSQLSTEVSDILDWKPFLSRSKLAHAKQVIVAQPKYLQDLKTLIENTPLRTLKLYSVAQLLNVTAPYMGQDFAQLHSDLFEKTLQGNDQSPPQWRVAVDLVNRYLGDAMGREYVKAHFSPQARTMAESIAQNVLRSFDTGIDEIAWMEAGTKQEAHRKLRNIVVKVGFSDNWQSYDDLLVTKDDLLGNILRGNQFNYQSNIDLLNQPVDRKKWRTPPQVLDASYNRSLNEMTFPASFLQPPFFDPEVEPAFNYGAIGSIIGHEVGHAFDDQGRKFDADGNLDDWWSDNDARVFGSLTQKLVEQYSAFEPVAGHRVNGELTLGENIGDLTGLAIAWRAYLLSLDGQEPPVISGYTAPQRFLIGYAQLWRWKYREEALISMLLQDPHAPPQFRANGPLMNLPLFVKTYQVTPGDKMYRRPEDRVKIW